MGSRILLADDSITIQKVVNLTFADEGIEVVAVSSGDLAARRLNEINPDLVLADIFMPGKNGYELCEAIKQSSQFRNVPVVLLVGAFEPFDQAEARRVRADAHLTKPFESRTLVETVRRLIGGSWRTTTGPIAPMPAIDERREELRDTQDTTPTSPPAPKLDLSEMTADRNVAPPAAPRSTGEFASPAPDTDGPQVFDLGAVSTPANEVVDATLTDTSERFDPIEPSSGAEFEPAEMRSRLDLDAQEMILDFEKSEPFAPATPDAISFGAEGGRLLDVDASGVGEEREWFNRDAPGATNLEIPLGADREAGATIPLASAHAPDVRPEMEAAFCDSGASTEIARTTLLAVDEPLGDVLLDVTLSAEPLPLSGTGSGDATIAGIAGPTVEEAELLASTQFDLVETSEDSSSQVLFDVAEEHKPMDAGAAEETLTVDDQPVAAGSPFYSHPASLDSDDRDWTSPRAGVYSTAQLDPVVMPIDASEHIAENSAGEDVQQAEDTVEATFTTTAMWTEEEARFTPIDIEAVPVEEPEAPARQASGADTGFSFLSAAEQPAMRPATSTANAAGGPAGAASPPAAQLSSAALEEIVRRVVAEISDSVVREVAWEVVPDCVERVIQQLTRETLSKGT